jgi:hypothetical protein
MASYPPHANVGILPEQATRQARVTKKSLWIAKIEQRYGREPTCKLRF